MENTTEQLIEKAYELVSPIDDTYDALNDVYYIVIKKDEDDEGEETGSCKSFCEKCIDNAIVTYKDKCPEEVKEKIVDYRYYNSTCSETDDFELCDSCGEIFDQACLLSDQELEHWEGVEEIDIKDPRECFQLAKIFNNSWGYGGQSEKTILEKEERVLNIAKRVIELFETLNS